MLEYTDLGGPHRFSSVCPCLYCRDMRLSLKNITQQFSDKKWKEYLETGIYEYFSIELKRREDL